MSSKNSSHLFFAHFQLKKKNRMENVAQGAKFVRSRSSDELLWCTYSKLRIYFLFYPLFNLGGKRRKEKKHGFFSAFNISQNIWGCSYNNKNTLIFCLKAMEKVCHKQGCCSILFYVHLYWYWKWPARETTGVKALKNWKTNAMLHFQPEAGYNVSWEKAFNRRKVCGKLMVTLSRIDYNWLM